MHLALLGFKTLKLGAYENVLRWLRNTEFLKQGRALENLRGAGFSPLQPNGRIAG